MQGADPVAGGPQRNMRNLVCAVVMETATKEAVMQALSTNFDWMVMLKLWLKQAIKDRHDSVLDSVLTVLNQI